jgi:predicted SAM-dependent methyltransferase
VKESEKRKEAYIKEKYFKTYLKGYGIDIGSGDSPVVSAKRCLHYDKQNNNIYDANTLADQADNSYDWVFSSHCLEHTKNPPDALANWWRVLRPNGYLIVIVPDFMLYEQFQWPSKYNGDHKQRFSLGHYDLPNHWSLTTLVESLPGAQIRYATTRDNNFDYREECFDRTLGCQMAEIEIVAYKRHSTFWDRGNRLKKVK